jgi:hypothetical protein
MAAATIRIRAFMEAEPLNRARGSAHCALLAEVQEGGVRLSIRLLTPLAPIMALVSGCAAQVYHPTKSASEMQADVTLCTREANHEVWFDPIAALYRAYDCLEDKGYRRSSKDFASQVERAFGEARHEQEAPSKPCRVPCVPPGTPRQ